jgi:hypothetical protein
LIGITVSEIRPWRLASGRLANLEGERMTGSAVLDTVLGLVFLFYALALLCSGLVEMISNWVKKRAKYLLRGITDLLDDPVPVEVVAADNARLQQMPATALTALLNPMVERQRYNAMLHAPVPTPPHAPEKPAGDLTTTPYEQPVHRDQITLADVMGHPLVQPFRHATSLGKPTRNPSYLPSSVFARTIVDLLTPGVMEPTQGDIEAGVRALDKSPQLQQSLSSLLRAAEGEFSSFMSGLQVWFDRRWIALPARTSAGPNAG